MSERRKWDKPNDFHALSDATAQSASSAAVTNDPVLEKQRQYIRMLEERNRLRKKLVAASKAQKAREQLLEREEAFVTTFNAPKPATTAAAYASSNSGGTSSSSTTVRKNKSAASLLPTRIGTSSASSASTAKTTFDSESKRLSRCGSAPPTSLRQHRRSDASESHRSTRAKWSKPQGPMTLAVENRDGRAHVVIADPFASDAKSSEPFKSGDGDDDDDDDESSDDDVDASYLEESFEAFDESDELDNDAVAERKDAQCSEPPAPVKAAAQAPMLASIPELSRTTTELVALVQHLSRAKQQALTDVLQRFHTSDQRDIDVQELRSSIGDPAIWQQLTAALVSSGGTSNCTANTTGASADAQALNVQRKREEAAFAAQEAAQREREQNAKEQAQRDAEARRQAMLQQLDDEERELEQLVEQKRQERLAKLRALAQEIDNNASLVVSEAKATTADSAKRKANNNVDTASLQSSASHSADSSTDKLNKNSPKSEAKRREASVSPTKRSRKQRCAKVATTLQLAVADDAKALAIAGAATAEHETKPVAPIVPLLQLSAMPSSFASRDDAVVQSTASSSTAVELRIKLLSTWGTTRAVGLTQISVYDRNGDELAVDLASLKVYADASAIQPLPNTHDMVRGLSRLFNGIAYTTNDQDMWLGRLSSAGTLQLSFQVPTAPSKLCVWNYNSRLVAACARDIEVLVAGKCVWTGSLPETFGDDDDDSVCTWINVQATTKKTASTTARTARQSSSASSLRSVDASDAKAQAQTVRVDTSSSLNAPGTPLWLARPVPSSSSAVTASVASDAKLDLFADDKGLGGGSLTARRRGKANGDNDGAGDAKADAKRHEYATHQTTDRAAAASEAKHWLVRDDNDTKGDVPRQTAAHAAPLSAHIRQCASTAAAWDSLEHFSKTNRSRLPPHTTTTSDIDSMYVTKSPSTYADAPDTLARKPSAESRTSSALLTDLKTMSSSPYGVARSSSRQQQHDAAATPSSASSLLLLATPRAYDHDVDSFDSPASETPAIPVLPCGMRLRLEIVSTWGDPHYVGLNGIELFDARGQLVTFLDATQQIHAVPASINVLDEYSDDPRVATNLVDGVNVTSDDVHMWLAPFTVRDDSVDHYVELELDAPTALSMVRIWNYNKSRAHSFRGVRHARLRLFASSRTTNDSDDEGTIIFDGEIAKALGVVRDADADATDQQSCEVVLFTRDERILHAIEANDRALLAIAQSNREEAESQSIAARVRRSMEMARPRTSTNNSSSQLQAAETYSDYTQQQRTDSSETSVRVGKDGRPETTATARRPLVAMRKSIDSWTTAVTDDEPQQQQQTSALGSATETRGNDSDGDDDDETLVRGRRLTITLLSTWGDSNYIGLTQLDVLVGKHGTRMPLDLSNIDATPRDLESLGYHGDPRTLDKLIDGTGTTCDDTHMWLVPFASQTVEIRIDLKSEQQIYGLRVWNYNKNSEDTHRGAKQLHVAVDGLLVSPRACGFVLRKAPGGTVFDFDQILQFDASASASTAAALYVERIRYPFETRAYKTPIVRQDYEPPLFPQGFVLKLVCWTTWGDPYYLGMNGVELYDYHGKRLPYVPQVVTATPYSIADINESGSAKRNDATDVRVPANLLNGRNKNTWDASDAWLAPLASSLGNSDGNIVFVVFDAPVVLSMIKFWNYSKTPERGVKDIGIYLDDLHLYSGTLRRAPSCGDGLGRLGTKVHLTEEFSQPILFSTNQAQVDNEKRKVLYCGTDEQDVLCINEGQVMQESKAMHRKPDPGAEGVVVDLGLRPTTAMCRS